MMLLAYVAVLMHAELLNVDDMLLISSDLRRMIKICDDEMKSLGLCFKMTVMHMH